MGVEAVHIASEPETVKGFTQVERLQSFGTAVKNLVPTLRKSLIAFAVK
jgi:hypothetical protein